MSAYMPFYWWCEMFHAVNSIHLVILKQYDLHSPIVKVLRRQHDVTFIGLNVCPFHCIGHHCKCHSCVSHYAIHVVQLFTCNRFTKVGESTADLTFGDMGFEFMFPFVVYATFHTIILLSTDFDSKKKRAAGSPLCAARSLFVTSCDPYAQSRAGRGRCTPVYRDQGRSTG